MSRRSKRVARLCELASRQEEVARFAMAKSEIAVRQAMQAKDENARRTDSTLNTELPPQLRGALIRASIVSAEREAARIVELEQRLETARQTWETERQKAASMDKLRERMEAAERELVERAAERELGDIISSRMARREMVAS